MNRRLPFIAWIATTIFHVEATAVDGEHGGTRSFKTASCSSSLFAKWIYGFERFFRSMLCDERCGAPLDRDVTKRDMKCDARHQRDARINNIEGV